MKCPTCDLQLIRMGCCGVYRCSPCSTTYRLRNGTLSVSLGGNNTPRYPEPKRHNKTPSPLRGVAHPRMFL